MNHLTKDKSIHDLLAMLGSRLGDQSFEIVDHWEADLYAVGIVNPADQLSLAYISTYDLPEGQYYLELESLLAPDAEMGFEFNEKYKPMGFEQLLPIVARHLGLKERFVE